MPYSLDGLNVVYTHQPATDNNDLLSGAPSQSDLSLEIWDRLPFELEDGQEQGSLEEKSDMKKSSEGSAELSHEGQSFAGFDGSMWEQQVPQPSQGPIPFPSTLPGNVDALQLLLSSLLQQQQAVPQLGNLSVAQLMAQQQSLSMPPSFLSAPSSAPVPAPVPQTRSAPDDATAPPPAKRARSRKLSASATSAETPESVASPDSISSTPLSASEDKRRRNTAASARFRQKKKEREAALESKAKELQDQVTGLEKECETLRRENNWLKGLVVGVTGAGAAQNTQAAN